jgi:hypothetical protein
VIGTGHGHSISKVRALRTMTEYELVGVSRPRAHEPALPENLSDLPSLFVDQIAADRTIEFVAIETADPDGNLALAEQLVRAGRYVHLDKPPGSADLRRLAQVRHEDDE